MGFEYAPEAGGRWILVNAMIDWEVAGILNPTMFEYPGVIEPPSSPQHLLRELLMTLAKNKLDGGYVHEVLSDGLYHVTIMIDARREKPHH